MLRAIPAIRQDIIVALFAYLKRHSHQYFQNHFAGSLLNKITDMSSGTVSILQKMDQTFFQVCVLVIAVIATFFVHPIFSVILMSWAIVFMLISLGFSKKITQRLIYFPSAKRLRPATLLIALVTLPIVVCLHIRILKYRASNLQLQIQ